MKPEKTAQHYDALASHWAGTAFNRLNGIAQHERAFRFVKNHNHAIDIGCGSSGRFLDMMIAKGFAQPEGLDISGQMLALAKERHPDLLFHQADICDWAFEKSYDFISAWDSVWHAPLEQQAGILTKLCRGLAPDGVLIYTSGAVDEPGAVTNPFLGQDLYTAALGIPHILKIVEQNDCICRHLENDAPPPGLHIYLVIQKRSA